MFLRTKTVLKLLLMLLPIASPCAAAEIAWVPSNEGAGLILIEGVLNSGDEQTFRRLAYKYRPVGVILNSEGGALLAGIEIGQTIRELDLSTGVPPAKNCASACALAWLGGNKRFMASSSRIGFHAAYQVQEGQAREVGAGNALVGAYLTRLGLPETAVLFMTSAAPKEMAWLTPSEAQKIGVALSVLDVPDPGQPPPSRAPEGKEFHFVTGLDPDGDNWLALKERPDIRSKRQAKLPPDTLLEVLERRDVWLRVKLLDGRSGWVASRYVGCCR